MSMVEFTGQTYGEATRQRESQRAMRPGPSPTGQMELGPFDRPTEFPDEPVTAGAPVGPGPNVPTVPVAIEPGSREDLRLKMRAMVSKYPNSALIALLEQLERS